MADDSDDDKPLLIQYKNSKGSVEANGSIKHAASASLHKSQEKGSKLSAHISSDKPSELMLKFSQDAGVVHDESTSHPEPPPTSGRLFAQKVQSVKVYIKRKKQSENEHSVAKKPKFVQVTSSECNSSVLSSKNFDQGNRSVVNPRSQSAVDINNASVIAQDSQHCEHDPDGNVVALENKASADFRGGGINDSSGGTHINFTKNNFADDGLAATIDPMASCNLSQLQSLLSKTAVEVGSDEEDYDLPLNKLSHSKKSKESLRLDLDKEEKKKSNFCSNKMRLKKDKGSVNGGEALFKQTAVTEECHKNTVKKHTAIKERKQLSEKFGDEKKMHKPAKDLVESKQAHSLSREEEDEDNLTLVQISRLKQKEAASGVKVSAAKEEEGSKKYDAGITTVHTKKPSEETITENCYRLPEGKSEDSALHADNVSLGKLSCTKNDNVADATNNVSEKVTDVSVRVVGKSRAKQLIALSRALADTDSEDEAGKGEETEDTDDNEEEEVEDEDEDDHYVGSKTGKGSALKSKRSAKISSTTLKGQASGRSKAPMPKSANKTFEMKQTYDDDNDDEDDAEEEVDDDGDESSQDDDDEWEDEEEYDVLRVTKRKKRAAGVKKVAQQKHARKKVKKMTDVPGAGGGQKWTTLQHNGVMFPPFYQAHGVKMLYERRPVDLTPEQEEVATMFAVMKETDYATKTKFLANFWKDWKYILGPQHIIQKLEECDFTPIYEWQIAEKEKKKQMTSQEKKMAKEEKLKQEEKYMWAVVDGVKEKVGNFRVEPPGLFRGRGEHPKMGKLKRRIYPEDIVINIGADSLIPECPIPGHRWKEIRHDDTVTWLAYWNDPINTKEQKYVFLAASSALKGQSDKEKYEKARVLKDYIEDIRKTYIENFTSADPTSRQIAVATYLIDQLALRAGNEKDDDEADTVGCCSLKVEHVTLIPPSSLQFDFLGKDSIRYFNVVEVVKPVYEAVGDFKKDKSTGSDIFDRLDTNKLNAHLKNIMPQLTAKVFRTYNASITLDNLLLESGGRLLAEKIGAYQRANKEVAILCNHQRSVSKSHGAQMEKLEGKLAELSDLVTELEQDLEWVRSGKELLKDSEGNGKKTANPDALERKILQTRQKMERMTLDMKIKEDLKTVALGTSKINYMDPRITVAWCKKLEVPIEKIFNKSLLAKFAWAMDVDPSFRF